ncbi:hypothetical protein [Alienimonas chondri]|uniref:XRE family transcriptional regulator n=1 Tax=Alienimonas chondri TaxID=2681879 RepID=A0ABX1V9A3_9PLAN|nr:hypothetical protein [Alienimonas chondri]NNJ24644.1 hypothetical protein [Alienimonas chondri]
MQPIRAEDLERWAGGTLEPRGLLPELVRRLVHGTTREATRVDFPAEKSVGKGGWDGTVVTPTANAWVPDRLSRWEMGVDAEAQDKATRDYRKRTRNTPKAACARAHYRFVTPRRWNGKTGKEAWAEKRAGDGWASVRVLDADDLEQWLENAPAAAFWFGRLLGRSPEATAVSDYLRDLAELTPVPLPPSVWLAGRKGILDHVGHFLQSQPASMAVEVGATGDGFEVLCATVHEAGAGDRALVLPTPAAWTSVSRAEAPLVLLPRPGVRPAPESVRRAVRAGHHVLRAAVEFVRPDIDALPVPRARRYRLAAALEEAGMDSLEAKKAAERCGGSLTALRFLTSEEPDEARPAWADAPASVAALWLGGWVEGFPGDRAAADELAIACGGDPRDLDETTALTRASGGDAGDPLLLSVGTHRRVLSKMLGWLHLAPRTAAGLDAFLAHAAAAFAGADAADRPGPLVVVGPPEMMPPKVGYSALFVEQAADTLAFLAAEGERTRLPFADRLPRLIDAVVREALAPGNWERWAGLGGALPLLAEAAPKAFLDAVDRDLDAEPSAVAGLFENTGAGGLSGRCEFANLMWALEALAWRPEYLSRVVRLLARLAPLKERSAGNWGNGPLGSLRTILCEWCPHTAAKPAARLRAIRVLAGEEGPGTWPALVTLFGHKASVSPSHAPTWREWAVSDAERRPTYGDLADQQGLVADELLRLAGRDPDRLLNLVNDLYWIPEDRLPALADRLREAAGDAADDDRARLTEALRDRLALTAHEDGEDPLGPHRPDLNDALGSLEPDDPAARHAWLFGNSFMIFYRPDQEHDAAQAAQADAEDAAMEEVIAAGEDCLQSLITRSVQPDAVGNALARRPDAADFDAALPADLRDEDPARRKFAAAFARQRFRYSGWAWVDDLNPAGWPPPARLTLALALPAGPETFDRAEDWGIEVDYWNAVRPYALPTTQDVADRSIPRLLAAGRAGDALKYVARAKDLQFEPELMTEALTKAADLGAESGDGYYIAQVLDRLRDAGTDADRLAWFQFQFLPLLERTSERLQELLDAIVSDAGVLTQLIAVRYPRRDGVPHPVIDKIRDGENGLLPKGLTDRATRLLYDLGEDGQPCPGFPAGRPDGDLLRSWIAEVRRLAAKYGRAEAAEFVLGRLLARSPVGDDGAWPHEIVRDVLEEQSDPDEDPLLLGFQTGHRNRGGTTCRMPDAGGAQEASLAERHRVWAAQVENEHPVVAAVLRRLTDDYVRDARREDADVEWGF